jgi:probable rRNA maturation factor
MTDSPLVDAATDDPVVEVVIESDAWLRLPDADAIVRRAIASAAAPSIMANRRGAEVSVLLCDDEAIASLNARWRGEERPTNVLSFPAQPLPQVVPGVRAPLGDIAVAYETVARESREEGKPVADHLSHLVVHGFLHLLGYDHQMDGEAERMERLEREILAHLGIADPYAPRDAGI